MRPVFSALALSLAGFVALPAHADTIVVFAAASLQNALDEAAKTFESKSGHTVKISYASSLPLARQIVQGAPADLFASADQESMDVAQKEDAIDAATRTDLLNNKLVVVAGADSKVGPLDFSQVAWTAALGEGRLAVGNPQTVPAGKYAKEGLSSLNLWTYAEPRLAGAANVRAALTFVARGEAPLGIVYATDARAEPRVKVVATFPETSHKPIVYPFALTKRSADNKAAQDFLAYLKSPGARPAFEKQGFTVMK